MKLIRIHGRGEARVGLASALLTAAIEATGREVQDRRRWHGSGPNDAVEVTLEIERVPAAPNEKTAPALVLVLDEALLSPPAPGMLSGMTRETELVIRSAGATTDWRTRLTGPGRIISLNATQGDEEVYDTVPVVCAAASAARLGVITSTDVVTAIRRVLPQLNDAQRHRCIGRAMQAYQAHLPRLVGSPKPDESSNGAVPTPC